MLMEFLFTDMSLYKETMYDVDHDNYIAVNDPEENPVVVSIDSDAVKEDGKKLYRAIVRTTKADTRGPHTRINCIPCDTNRSF